ncbi:MAG: hypothetical protein UY72_C0025G0011 [Candidatus Uhrbacteria bacterium GW2011_GWD2_52_7]|uniref:Uncharacterized protein n=1 Tax=Candidatus Uhrbacteria bacterium GW2011_GWD2_52_7 TaxID=1618989 RepID=A0A0G1XGJ8_9BACT|nr:MAG: hypothetical protein UY72_C0025G0011 [Candidatus Uhrbacteria bacterium GW2011_GWD2_52_7]
MNRALGLSILVAAVGVSISVFIWKGYISTPWTKDAPGRAATLAPSDWLRHSTDVWSIAYPSAWEAVVNAGEQTTEFQPSLDDGTTTYFSVKESSATYVATQREYDERLGAYQSTGVVIANYAATRYDFGSGRVDYVIDYPDRVVVLSSDVPTNDDVGIMMATFVFLK